TVKTNRISEDCTIRLDVICILLTRIGSRRKCYSSWLKSQVDKPVGFVRILGSDLLQTVRALTFNGNWKGARWWKAPEESTVPITISKDPNGAPPRSCCGRSCLSCLFPDKYEFPYQVPSNSAGQVVCPRGRCVRGAEAGGIDRVSRHQRPH